MKKIYSYEPYFFIFFGIFHLHRIWGLVDREDYATFWINVYGKQRNILFFVNGHISGALYIGNYYILQKSTSQLLVAVDISVRWWICVI